MSERQSKKLSELDPESPEYWERVLRDHGLGINRGRNTSKLSYIGGPDDVEKAEASHYEKAVFGGRKVRPTGAKPE